MANEKTAAILEEIKTLTILELADLVKALEEEFGLSIEDQDVGDIKTVGDVVNYITERQ